MAHDPKAVVMFEGGEVFRPERTLLARRGRTLADAAYAELAPLRPVPAPGEPAAPEAPDTPDDREEALA